MVRTYGYHIIISIIINLIKFYHLNVICRRHDGSKWHDGGKFHQNLNQRIGDKDDNGVWDKKKTWLVNKIVGMYIYGEKKMFGFLSNLEVKFYIVWSIIRYPECNNEETKNPIPFFLAKREKRL